MTATDRIPKEIVWKLEGYDTFEGKSYPIKGSFHSREKAMKAAKRELKKLEKSQPSKHSGGQSGIQDQVYIIEYYFRVKVRIVNLACGPVTALYIQFRAFINCWLKRP